MKLTLGSIIENSLLQSLMMSTNGAWIFFTRPVSLFFVALSVLFIVTTYRKPKDVLAKMMNKRQNT